MELSPKRQRLIRIPHRVRALARLEGRVVQCRLSVDEDSSSATACLHRDPVARFILPNDELQTRIPAARFPRFADT